jgi:hypothetical protein
VKNVIKHSLITAVLKHINTVIVVISLILVRCVMRHSVRGATNEYTVVSDLVSL